MEDKGSKLHVKLNKKAIQTALDATRKADQEYKEDNWNRSVQNGKPVTNRKKQLAVARSIQLYTVVGMTVAVFLLGLMVGILI